MKRILFITSTRIGDAVINSGVLDYLVRQWPEAKFTIACGPLAQPVLENTPGLERLIIVRKKPFGLHWFGLWRRVVMRHWDLVVDLRGSAISYLLIADQRKPLKSTKVKMHKVREAAGVLRLDPPPAPKIYLAEEARERALAWMPPGRDWLAVCPSASLPFKMWPATNFAEVVKALVSPGGAMADAGVVIVGGPGDEDHAIPIINALPDNGVMDLTGKLYLSDVAAVVERARLFIGNDSGLMHMSAAMGTPTLGLFGPSDEMLYGPYGDQCATVRGPRGLEETKTQFPDWRHHPSSLLDDLSVGAVLEAANRLLKRTEEK
jgi:lipopolysaccharide heptosyltransferase III